MITNNKVRIFFLTVFVLMFVFVFTGCGSNDSNEKTDLGTNAEYKEEFMDDVCISTEYIPIDYRNNALIVQRSENTELFGVLDNDGKIVVEPKYDSLEFVSMEGREYIRASLEGNISILSLDGHKYIEFGSSYDKVVSAGDTGWLAKKNNVRYLLNKKGKVIRELKGIYLKVLGDKYLLSYNEEFLNENDFYDNVNVDYYLEDSDNMDNGYKDIYDLEENLLIESAGINIKVLEDGSILRTNDEMVLQHIDEKGNILAELGKGHADIFDNKILVEYRTQNDQDHEIGTFVYDPKLHKLSSESLEDCVDTDTEKKVICSGKVIAVKDSGMYRIYDNEGNKLTDERYNDYTEEDQCIILENIDNEIGCINTLGNVVVPFGMMGRAEYGDCLYSYDGKDIEEYISSDGYFGFYLYDSMENVYSFYSFKV